jgi:hypothetical protein
MLSESDLEDLVRKVILIFNRTRSPEVTAKSVFVSPASITVSFSGGFCYGCGVMDYVEGFAQQFKALSGKAELKIGKTKQINPRNFEADYIIKIK